MLFRRYKKFILFCLESDVIESAFDSGEGEIEVQRAPPLRITKRNSIASMCEEQNTSAAIRQLPKRFCSMDEVNLADKTELPKESFHRVDVSYY